MKDHDLEKWFLFIAEYRSTKTEDVYIYKYWSILHVHESTCGTECYCTSMLEREGHTHLWCILHHLIQYKLLFWFINSYIQFLLKKLSTCVFHNALSLLIRVNSENNFALTNRDTLIWNEYNFFELALDIFKQKKNFFWACWFCIWQRNSSVIFHIYSTNEILSGKKRLEHFFLEQNQMECL